MTSKSVAFLLADLGITKTHSRPHVSNDNPFSEAQFKTLKYRPDFPERFGSIQGARAYCDGLFPWYNTEHHHSGLGLLTPYDVHYGLAEQRVSARAAVLATAYSDHPERFPAGPPTPAARPTEVWINPPNHRTHSQSLTQKADRGTLLRSMPWRTAMSEPEREPILQRETIAGLAHDIKTPLTSILAFIDLIREPTPKDSESCRKRIAR
jgi:signal transduction histidine kinase